MRALLLVAALCAVAAGAAAGAGGAGAAAPPLDDYFCLEEARALGSLLRRVPIANASNVTSGAVARRCAAACTAAAPACTAFRAAGGPLRRAPLCELLANTTARLEAQLVLEPEHPWPRVIDNLTAVGEGGQLRSTEWLCWREQRDWDAYGAATHNLVMTGAATPAAAADWHCSFGLDTAGTNLRQDTAGITHPSQCQPLCTQNATGCTLWIFVATRDDKRQFQSPFNCFAKADAFRGQNGWTAAPKTDLWDPNSQVTCFKSLRDWRHVGLVLSPAVGTVHSTNGTYYTLFPERVTWAEAAAACARLPGNGSLAVLDSPPLLDWVTHALIDTIQLNTGVRSAWVAARGNNTAYDPAAANATVAALASGRQVVLPQPAVRNPVGPEATLTWPSGQPVDSSMLRRLTSLGQLWTSHDVVWSQQYVPPSARDVCGRALVQVPGASAAADLTLPADVLPGLWYFDCLKPASFVCQSSQPPAEPMSGRQDMLARAANDLPAAPPVASTQPGALAPWGVALAVVLPALAVALLTFQLVRVYSRQVSRLPELIRQQKKRAMGPPRTGRMSLVITDIQSFTHLMQAAPEQMTQALLIHNTVIRHAAYDNVGWVVEQEGDSFSVSFADAEDAVAFCLQVQQALLAQGWPPNICYGDGWEGACSFSELRTASQKQQPQHSSASSMAAAAPAPCGAKPPGDGRGDAAEGPSGVGAVSSVPQQRLLAPDGPSAAGDHLEAGTAAAPAGQEARPGSGGGAGDNGEGASCGRVLHWLPGLSTGNASAPARASSTCPAAQPRCAPLGLERPKSAASMLPDDARQPSAWLARLARLGSGGSALLRGTSLAAASVADSRRSSATGHVAPPRWLQQLLGPRGGGAALFRGLRVRCGVATGVVPKGQELKSSALYRMAQDVSSAALGGELLLDEPTFVSVKDSMWRLGAVGAAGIDYDQLLESKRLAQRGAGSGDGPNGRAWSVPGRCFSRITERSRRSMALSNHTAGSTNGAPAIALDMGAYELLSPADPAHPAHPGHEQQPGTVARRSTAARVQLWSRELGDRLVAQFQHYLTAQLSHSHSSAAPPDDASAGPLELQHLDEEAAAYGLAPAATRRSGGGGGSAAPRFGSRPSFSRRSLTSLRTGSLRGMSVSGPAAWQQLTAALFGVTPAAGQYVVPRSGESMLEASSWRPHAAAAPGFCSISAVLRPTVRLYQVLSPGLAGRAALFGQKLDLPASWRVLDPPYFAAPGLSSLSFIHAAAAQSPAGLGSPAPAQQPQGRKPGRTSTDSWQAQLLARLQPLTSATSLPEASAAASAGSASSVRSAVGLGQPAAGVLGSPRAGEALVSGPAASATSPFMQAAQHRDSEESSAAGLAAVAAAAAAAASAAVPDSPGRQHGGRAPRAPSSAATPGSAVGGGRGRGGLLSPAPSNQLQQSPSSVALLAVRNASLQTSWQLPHGDGGGDESARTGQAGMRLAAYPPVTILFAIVEGASELLEHPDLARSVHSMLHHLMLQLLRSFSGSYCVRAQQADLKYMLAFTSPTAAVEFGLTLQEAALYLPYPQELLTLSSFGVQLDEASRLVFRGPRFAMGMSEGVPTLILPDHAGRADYHASFVNTAARYAVAAAQGGQLATDGSLAQRVLWLWRSSPGSASISGGGSSATSSHARATPLSRSWTDGSAGGGGGEAAAATAASGGEGAAATAASGACATSGREARDAPAVAAAAEAAADRAGTCPVAVECSWLGSYLFKGNPSPVAMVFFAPSCLAGRQYAAHTRTGTGKGVRVLQRVGVMDRAEVRLPAAVEGFAPFTAA